MCPEKSKLIDSIRQQNREFRKLEEEHQSYEDQLNELLKQTHLTPRQEILKKKIKKQKLRTKDRMAEIIREFHAEGHHAPEDSQHKIMP